MTIYVFAGGKGGVGKTTLALNTAVALISMGRKVLAVDTDDQRGLAKLVAARSGQKDIPQFNAVTLRADPKNPSYVAETLLRHADDYQDIIIDTPPGTLHLELRSALMVAQELVTPCQPSALDLATFEAMDMLVGQAKAMNPALQARVVLNRCSVNKGSSKAAEAREDLSHFAQYCTMQAEIKNRDAFMEAVVLGRSAAEYKYSTEKARTEMDAFTQELINHG